MADTVVGLGYGHFVDFSHIAFVMQATLRPSPPPAPPHTRKLPPPPPFPQQQQASGGGGRMQNDSISMDWACLEKQYVGCNVACRSDEVSDIACIQDNRYGGL